MKSSLILFIIILSNSLLHSQNVYSGLYSNEEKSEFICFENDTVSYKIFNNDGFGSFTVGKGRYEIKKKGKYCILKTNIIAQQSATIKKHPRSDEKLSITVQYANSVPMNFVKLSIANSKNISSIKNYNSDINGKLTLNAEQISFLNDAEATISVDYLGFTTEKNAALEIGYDYIVQSVIRDEFPFVIDEYNKIKISKISEDEVKIESRYKKSSILYKNKDNNCCSGLLFSMGK